MLLDHDQRGFTLVELLVAMMLGMVVLGAVFSLTTASGRATKNISDRIDSAQRGRTAMEQMTQALRTMACLPEKAPTSGVTSPEVKPIVAASGTSITWYANFVAAKGVSDLADSNWAPPASDAHPDPTFEPHQRRLTYVPDSTGAKGSIVEEIWTGRMPVTPASKTADQRRVLITDVAPVGATPIFGYGAFAAPSAAEATPYTPGDLDRIVKIDLTFTVSPTERRDDARSSADMQGSVYARTVDRAATPNPVFACKL